MEALKPRISPRNIVAGVWVRVAVRSMVSAPYYSTSYDMGEDVAQEDDLGEIRLLMADYALGPT